MKRINIKGEWFLHSFNMGFASEDRVKEALSKGWLVSDKERKDYGFTERATKVKGFWKWLQGEPINVREQELETMPEPKKAKRGTMSAEDKAKLFDNM